MEELPLRILRNSFFRLALESPSSLIVSISTTSGETATGTVAVWATAFTYLMTYSGLSVSMREKGNVKEDTLRVNKLISETSGLHVRHIKAVKKGTNSRFQIA